MARRLAGLVKSPIAFVACRPASAPIVVLFLMDLAERPAVCPIEEVRRDALPT
jgi:hypothetical protein